MVNKVILIGNLGADPEVRTLENGTKVARIRIATTERYMARETQERKEHTEWHHLTLWRGLASLAEQYMRKGSKIYVEGRIRTREWVDENQQRRFSTEIQADVVNLLDSRQNSESGGYAPQQQGGYSQPQQQGYSQAQGGYSQPQQQAAYSQPQQAQGGYSQPSYGQQPSPTPSYGQSAPNQSYPRPAAAPAPAPAPSVGADDSDDLPF